MNYQRQLERGARKLGPQNLAVLQKLCDLLYKTILNILSPQMFANQWVNIVIIFLVFSFFYTNIKISRYKVSRAKTSDWLISVSVVQLKFYFIFLINKC